MRRDLLALLRHFMTPEDHQGLPAAFFLTQAAHFGAVGVPAAWAALAAGASPVLALAMVGVGYAGVETAQARFGTQSLKDAATDTAFVLLGAAFLICAIAGVDVAATACLVAALLGAILGAMARRR